MPSVRLAANLDLPRKLRPEANSFNANRLLILVYCYRVGGTVLSASLNYSVRALLFTNLIFFVTMPYPCLAFFVLPLSTAVGWIATALVWHLAFAFMVYPLPGSWKLMPLFMFGPCLMAFAYWRSAVIILRQGGVKWRDSFYPLKQLRDALYK
jgi:hypothetical protein